MEIKKEYPGDKPIGKTRTFNVRIQICATMTLDESVIEQGLLPEGYILGPNPSREQVMEHLAFNLVGAGIYLNEIDGYANCPRGSATVTHRSMDVEEIEEQT
jgi:hypothetical protein